MRFNHYVIEELIKEKKCLNFEHQLSMVKAVGISMHVFHSAAEVFAVLERIHL